MVFFDLNIPYLEGEQGSEKQPKSHKNNRKNDRLKTVVKAMELGYTGIAYNRTVKGVMADSDRCTISLLPLSSLLKLAPTLSTSVKFHREALKVPLNSPFRQYTRLTVVVDSLIHAAALNSGNPVLKTYDLVAVKPLNQAAFDQACGVSEVDLIAIDFSEKLPFRLKLPMVKAAIKRGIYFEVTYSHLISDIQARRQMVSNAQLLVAWTRGKNLILSSAATSANELRGPYDVANLSGLLCLSMERAKAAVSKNCRSLIANALRKKQCYKEAIRIERISSGGQADFNELLFGDFHSWDRISSGEGDLLLDDIAKCFSASSKVPKSSKAIDFSLIIDTMPPNGMQLKYWLPGSGGELQLPDSTSNVISAAKEFEGSAATNEVFKNSDGFNVAPNADCTSLTSSPLKHQNSDCLATMSLNATSIVFHNAMEIEIPSYCAEEPNCLNGDQKSDFLDTVSPNATSIVFNDAMEIESPTSCEEEPNSLIGVDVVLATTKTSAHFTMSQDHIFNCEENLVLQDDVIVLTSGNDNEPSAACGAHSNKDGLDIASPSKDCVSTVAGDLVSEICTVDLTPLYVIDLSPSCDEDYIQSNEQNIVLDAQGITEEVPMESEEKKQTALVLSASDGCFEKKLTEIEEKKQIISVLAACDGSFHEDFAKAEQCEEQGDGAAPAADDMPLQESCDEMQGALVFAADGDPFERDLVEMEERKQEGSTEINHQIRDELKSGKGKFKRKTPHVFPIPFKRILKPLLFKRKSRKSKNKMNLV